MVKPKNIIIPTILILVSWFSWSTYVYFCDASDPELVISGLEDNSYCSGDSECIISGSDSYKVSHITVSLDGRIIVNKFNINRRQFEHPLTLPTKSLPNGKHLLKVKIVDGSYKQHEATKEITFFVDNTPLQAVFVRPSAEYKVFQGRTLHLQFQVNKQIKQAKTNLLSKSFECFPESKGSLIYECFVPISCEELHNEYPFSIVITDFTNKDLILDGKFQIMPYPFKQDRIAPQKATLENIGLNQQVLEDELKELVRKSPKEKLWQGVFYVPLEMIKISCDYGTKRITQEKGCYIHKALDLTATPRTVVWAPQDGIIVIKNRYTHSGNTIVIDHGYGIFSLLFHLDSFANINVGDKIKRGSPVGLMGKTGYATGYHLHWEMRIGNEFVIEAIDPWQWVKWSF